jgi:hypothetical protein
LDKRAVNGNKEKEHEGYQMQHGMQNTMASHTSQVVTGQVGCTGGDPGSVREAGVKSLALEFLGHADKKRRRCKALYDSIRIRQLIL